MSDTAVKPKRYRAPRKILDFSTISTTGEVKESEVCDYLNQNSKALTADYMICSPYTSLIPLNYVTRRHFLIQKDFDPMRHLYGRARNDKLKKGIIGRISYDGNFKDEYLIDTINSYLFDDSPMSIVDISCGYGYNSSTHIGEWFKRYGNILRFNLRTWRGRVGELLFMYKDCNRWETGGKYKPVVLPVILPENYMYHRLRMITGQPLDMSKVILLIDKDIQGTSYPQKSVRKAYMTHIRPVIETLACQSYYVPLSYIEDMCFIRPYQLKSKGFRAMREEKEQYIKEFLKYLSEEKVEGIPTPTYAVGIDPAGLVIDTSAIPLPVGVSGTSGPIETFITDSDGSSTYTYRYEPNMDISDNIIVTSWNPEDNVNLQNGEENN